MKKEAQATGGLPKAEGDKLIATYRAMREEGIRRFEATPFPCPVDGKPARYTGDVGSLQIVVPVYQCPDGHTFSVRITSQGNLTKLLSPQGSTPNAGAAK